MAGVDQQPGAEGDEEGQPVEGSAAELTSAVTPVSELIDIDEGDLELLKYFVLNGTVLEDMDLQRARELQTRFIRREDEDFAEKVRARWYQSLSPARQGFLVVRTAEEKDYLLRGQAEGLRKDKELFYLYPLCMQILGRDKDLYERIVEEARERADAKATTTKTADAAAAVVAEEPGSPEPLHVPGKPTSVEEAAPSVVIEQGLVPPVESSRPPRNDSTVLLPTIPSQPIEPADDQSGKLEAANKEINYRPLVTPENLKLLKGEMLSTSPRTQTGKPVLDTLIREFSNPNNRDFKAFVLRRWFYGLGEKYQMNLKITVFKHKDLFVSGTRVPDDKECAILLPMILGLLQDEDECTIVLHEIMSTQNVFVSRSLIEPPPQQVMANIGPITAKIPIVKDETMHHGVTETPSADPWAKAYGEVETAPIAADPLREKYEQLPPGIKRRYLLKTFQNFMWVKDPDTHLEPGTFPPSDREWASFFPFCIEELENNAAVHQEIVALARAETMIVIGQEGFDPTDVVKAFGDLLQIFFDRMEQVSPQHAAILSKGAMSSMHGVMLDQLLEQDGMEELINSILKPYFPSPEEPLEGQLDGVLPEKIMHDVAALKPIDRAAYVTLIDLVRVIKVLKDAQVLSPELVAIAIRALKASVFTK